MTQKLSTRLPSNIFSAAAAALARGQMITGSQSVWQSARDRHMQLALEERDRDAHKLGDLATGIFEWGLEVRTALASAVPELHELFLVPNDEDGPHISLVNEQMRLEPREDTPECLWAAELSLSLRPDCRNLFRCVERFDGYRLRLPSDDRVASATELQNMLHPKMLRAIHRRIADGLAWPRMEYALGQLKPWCKDG